MDRERRPRRRMTAHTDMRTQVAIIGAGPSGLLLGGKFTIMDYLIWNEIPTVVGNLVGGLAFTGLTLYATHVRTAPKRVAARVAA